MRSWTVIGRLSDARSSLSPSTMPTFVFAKAGMNFDTGSLMRSRPSSTSIGDRNDRLGHRIDAEDRVVAHRRPAGSQGPDRLAVSDPAVPGDQHGEARSLLLLDLTPHDCGEPLEPFRNKPQRFGRRVGEGEGTHGAALFGSRKPGQ